MLLRDSEPSKSFAVAATEANGRFYKRVPITALARFDGFYPTFL